MPRIWKGAITFGLVHVPVALYPASEEIGMDFDWLDNEAASAPAAAPAKKSAAKKSTAAKSTAKSASKAKRA